MLFSTADNRIATLEPENSKRYVTTSPDFVFIRPDFEIRLAETWTSEDGYRFARFETKYLNGDAKSYQIQQFYCWYLYEEGGYSICFDFDEQGVPWLEVTIPPPPGTLF